MALTSPSRQDRAGPLEAFSRLFKSTLRPERSSENEDLSRILKQTHIAGGTPPRKPLPNLPLHSQHQRSYQLPQSTSLQCYLPSNNNYTRPHQIAEHNKHHAGPSSYQHDSLPHMPIPTPYIQRERPYSVDHLAVAKMPNPWEIVSPVPASSLPPAFLTPPRPIRPVSAPTFATSKKTIKRPRFNVSDPLQLPGLHQCWGIKRDGNRCTRKLGSNLDSPSKRRTPSKSPSPSKAGARIGDAIIVQDSDDESSTDGCSEDDERRGYCHQHSKEINKTNGFVLPGLRRIGSKGKAKTIGGDGKYIDFGIILSGILSRGGQEEESFKAKLRTAMCRSPSEVDWIERGYIYIYELRDRSNNTHIALKVGRAVNVFKRIEQWRSQCQSKDPTLRAFFPRPDGINQDVLPGAATVLEKGVLLSHKWERLIHMELSYLGKRLDDKCVDCGSRHREIFSIPREINGEKVGYEGVQKAVKRWLSFVRVVESDGMGGQQQE